MRALSKVCHSIHASRLKHAFPVCFHPFTPHPEKKKSRGIVVHRFLQSLIRYQPWGLAPYPAAKPKKQVQVLGEQSGAGLVNC